MTVDVFAGSWGVEHNGDQNIQDAQVPHPPESFRYVPELWGKSSSFQAQPSPFPFYNFLGRYDSKMMRP